MHTFSEADFSAAMERAVEKRGSDWRYPTDRSTPGFFCNGIPTYSDEKGNATCLIGAAMYELGTPVPHYGPTGSTFAVLRDLVPVHVQVAARCAQIHQDLGKPWGESFYVYRAALSLYRSQSHYDAVHGVNHLYYQAVAVVTGRISADQAMLEIGKAAQQASAYFETFADAFLGDEVEVTSYSGKTVVHQGIVSGGWCAPSEFAWQGLHASVTINMPVVSKGAYSIMTGGPFKHEHALTA